MPATTLQKCSTFKLVGSLFCRPFSAKSSIPVGQIGTTGNYIFSLKVVIGRQFSHQSVGHVCVEILAVRVATCVRWLCQLIKISV